MTYKYLTGENRVLARYDVSKDVLDDILRDEFKLYDAKHYSSSLDYEEAPAYLKFGGFVHEITDFEGTAAFLRMLLKDEYV